MNLIEFLAKWAGEDAETEQKIKASLSAFFDRDPRTIRNWLNKTPQYVRWNLKRLDKEWEQLGKINYAIFFDD